MAWCTPLGLRIAIREIITGGLLATTQDTLQQAAVYTDTPNWNAGRSGKAEPRRPRMRAAISMLCRPTARLTRTWAARIWVKAFSSFRPQRASRRQTTSRPMTPHRVERKRLDLGSSGALLLPDAAGSPAHPHLLVSGSKSGTVYLLDRDNLGQFQMGGNNQIVQSLDGAVGPIFGIPAYFNNTVYFSGGARSGEGFFAARRTSIRASSFNQQRNICRVRDLCPAFRPMALETEFSGPSTPPASCTLTMRPISAISSYQGRLIRLSSFQRQPSRTAKFTWARSTAWLCLD